MGVPGGELRRPEGFAKEKIERGGRDRRVNGLREGIFSPWAGIIVS
jgi:hypothetical protein